MIKNVLKEDFYRLKRSKTLWICLTVAVVFSFLITTFYNFAIELAGEYGVYTGVDLNEYMAPELMAAMAFLNAELPIFCMIFAAALVAGEFAQGTLRQILASGAGRVGVYFSKWLKVFVASVFLYVATVVVSYLAGLMYWKPQTDYLGIMFGDIGLGLLGLAGYSSLYVALAFMMRSAGGVIGEGIGLHVLVNLLTNPLGTNETVVGFFETVNKLTMSGAYSAAVGESGVSAVLYAVFVPLVYLALCGVVGMLNFVKRDVR